MNMTFSCDFFAKHVAYLSKNVYLDGMSECFCAFNWFLCCFGSAVHYRTISLCNSPGTLRNTQEQLKGLDREGGKRKLRFKERKR